MGRWDLHPTRKKVVVAKIEREFQALESEVNPGGYNPSFINVCSFCKYRHLWREFGKY